MNTSARLSRRRFGALAIGSLAALTSVPVGRRTAVASPIRSARADADEIVVGVARLRAPNTIPAGGLAPNANVYECLTRLDDRFQAQPSLAERWELVDGDTWRFSLRRGVQFHDGSPFTAADAVDMFERVAKRGGGTIYAVPGGARAVDDYTVDFRPGRPNRKAPLQLNEASYWVGKAGNDSFANSNGTGPFRLTAFDPAQHVKVERFDGYWNRDNLPQTRAITLKGVPDSSARVLALRAGDLDMADDIPREAARDLDRDSRLRLHRSTRGGYLAFYINVGGADEFALTADLTLRRAIAHAINRETIIREIYEGNAEDGSTLVPPSVLGGAAGRIAGGPAFDPAAAERLLDEAGWVKGADGIRALNGRRLELVLGSGYPIPQVLRPIPEVIQTMLRRVGADVKILEVDKGSIGAVADDAGRLRLHMWLEAYGQPDADPGGILSFFQQSATDWLAAYGRAFGPSPKVDDLILSGLAAPDLAAAQAMAAEGIAELVDHAVTVVPLAGTYKLWATSDRIEGFVVHPAPNHEVYAPVRKR